MIQLTRSAAFVFLIAAITCDLCNSQSDWSDFQPQDFTEQVNSAVDLVNERNEKGPYQPSWDSLAAYQAPDWYKDAKLGIFIHWGVYCVPEIGNEWYPRNMYIDQKDWRGNMYKHHLKTYGEHKDFGYKDFIKDLTASNFDAKAWAKLFKESGARYVIPVAEHHDGFTMYDCSFTQWSSTKMGPKRDIVAELANAVREEDLYFGVSSHRAFNWLYFVRNENYDNADPKFAGLYGRAIPQLFEQDAWDYKNKWPAHDEQFKNEWLARTCELVDKYSPDIIWFDFGIGNRDVKKAEDNPWAPHLQKFASYYYNAAANSNRRVPVINYKWHAFPEDVAVLDLERSKLDKTRDLFWQTDTSVAKNSWGYTAKQNYKSVNRILDDFVDIVSKNGCLLLNVGPRKDGTIPEPEQDMLREIGQWMKVNGEAIYGSRPFAVFGEGPTGTVTGHLSENKNKPYVAEDFRYTTKGDAVYAFVLDKPKGGQANFKMLGKRAGHLSQKIKEVTLLGYDGQIEWKQSDQGLSVSLPDENPCDHVLVLKVK